MRGMVMNPESDTDTPPSMAVVEAIADHEGVDPIDLERPLFDVVDTDALDAFIGHDGSPPASNAEVRFTYDGYRVRVSGDGSVDVTPSEA